MKPASASLVAAGVLLALAPAARADHLIEGGHTVRCGPKRVANVKPLAQTSEAVVFEKVKPDRYGGRLPYAYGCLKKYGPIRLLPVDPGSFYRVRGTGLAGRYAAIVKRSEEGGSPYWDRLLVYDLTAGRVVSDDGAWDGRGHVGDTYIQSVVVKRNGAVAWLSLDADDNLTAVRKRDAGASSAETLDPGPGIDGRAGVRLSPDRRSVMWTRDGVERSAPLR
jgi:hypothetical protein